MYRFKKTILWMMVIQFFVIAMALAETLTVTSPVSNELLVKGQAYPIEWITDDPSLNAKILLFKGEVKVSTLVSSTLNNGLYEWTVPNDLALGNDYKVKVVCPENPGVCGFSDPFEICRPGDLYTPIDICVPDSNCVWEMGGLYPIEWTGGNPGTAVKIRLFKGKTAVETIAASAPCDPNGGGAYNWEVPYSLTAGTNYRIKIFSTDYSYVNDASRSFEIAIPGLYVTSPNGGEIWKSATKRQIKWARGPDGNFVKIQLLDSSGTLVKVLAPSTPDDGIWTWKIPATLVPAQYAIRVISLDIPSRIDESDAVFDVVYNYDRTRYTLEEFRRYDVRGEHWDYRAYINGDGPYYNSVQVLNRFKQIEGHTCNVVSTTSGDNTAEFAWFTDASGRHIEQWIVDTTFGKLKIDMNSILVAPTSLQIGTPYANSGQIWGTINGTFNYYGTIYTITGTVSGRCDVSARLVGWEDVTVPYGTYKAMKLKVGVSIPDAYMYITVVGVGSGVAKFTANNAETGWGVPHLGIVKVNSNVLQKITIEGETQTNRSIIEAELTNYYSTR